MNKKIDFTLLPVEFFDVVKVLQHSAESGKYERDGWLKGIGYEDEKNDASILRHFIAKRSGQVLDPETGLHTYLHAACRCLMAYTLWKRKNKDEELYQKAKEFEEVGGLDKYENLAYKASEKFAENWGTYDLYEKGKILTHYKVEDNKNPQPTKQVEDEGYSVQINTDGSVHMGHK